MSAKQVEVVSKEFSDLEAKLNEMRWSRDNERRAVLAAVRKTRDSVMSALVKT